MSSKGLVGLMSTGQSPETHFTLQGVRQKGSLMHIVLNPRATSLLASPGFFPVFILCVVAFF